MSSSVRLSHGVPGRIGCGLHRKITQTETGHKSIWGTFWPRVGYFMSQELDIIQSIKLRES